MTALTIIQQPTLPKISDTLKALLRVYRDKKTIKTFSILSTNPTLITFYIMTKQDKRETYHLSIDRSHTPLHLRLTTESSHGQPTLYDALVDDLDTKKPTSQISDELEYYEASSEDEESNFHDALSQDSESPPPLDMHLAEVNGKPTLFTGFQHQAGMTYLSHPDYPNLGLVPPPSARRFGAVEEPVQVLVEGGGSYSQPLLGADREESEGESSAEEEGAAVELPHLITPLSAPYLPFAAASLSAWPPRLLLDLVVAEFHAEQKMYATRSWLSATRSWLSNLCCGCPQIKMAILNDCYPSSPVLAHLRSSSAEELFKPSSKPLTGDRDTLLTKIESTIADQLKAAVERHAEALRRNARALETQAEALARAQVDDLDIHATALDEQARVLHAQAVMLTRPADLSCLKLFGRAFNAPPAVDITPTRLSRPRTEPLVSAQQCRQLYPTACWFVKGLTPTRQSAFRASSGRLIELLAFLRGAMHLDPKTQEYKLANEILNAKNDKEQSIFFSGWEQTLASVITDAGSPHYSSLLLLLFDFNDTANPSPILKRQYEDFITNPITQNSTTAPWHDSYHHLLLHNVRYLKDEQKPLPERLYSPLQILFNQIISKKDDVSIDEIREPANIVAAGISHREITPENNNSAYARLRTISNELCELPSPSLRMSR